MIKKILFKISYPFLLFHLAGLIGLFYMPINAKNLSICFGTYFFKTFFLTGGYHRYFAHRSFKMNRFWQFIFAFLGGTNGQKGALWWAALHRHHHKYSDQPEDVHSPFHQKWFCHGGWVLVKRHTELKKDLIGDFLKFPELVWLDKHFMIPVLSWSVLMYYLWGWDGVFWGMLISVLLNWHTVFIINSIGHLWGTQEYESNDHSRNNFFTALITMGEGWHNNHHAYSNYANSGFHWWQIDFTYYILIFLEKIGIVHDLNIAPYKDFKHKDYKISKKI